MKKLLLLVAIFAGFVWSANAVTVSGKVTDGVSGEALYNASVLYGPGKGTVTDFTGSFSFDLKPGTYTLTASYLGYKQMEKTITVGESPITVDFPLEISTLVEIEVVADIALDRETPVAFSNIEAKQIQEELATQDLPMLLNSTPGVYATQQGGGDGDARITIRGFDQRNVAVMIDGIPVNDMENGWVYWSNWSGLDMVTKTVQVQRGLGASKLAIPSVGGTMNIITKGIDAKKSFSIKQQVGNNWYSKTSLSYSTGRLENGWGVTLAGAYKRGDGWVEENWTQGGFYFLRVDKQFGEGKHTLSFNAIGGPQKHGQRTYQKLIDYYDADFARSLFEGSQEEYMAFVTGDFSNVSLSAEDSLNLFQNFVDTTKAKDYGLRHNEFWGYLNRYEVTSEGDTIFEGQETLNERVNFYHKPQISLRHSWAPTDKFFLSTVGYVSIGMGGGTSDYSTNIPVDETGHRDWMKAYHLNRYGIFNDPNNPKSSYILDAARNNHIWTGLLSTFNFAHSSMWNFSGGVDLRYYKGSHYNQVHDLLGGNYMIDGNSSALEGPNVEKYVGDKIQFHNDGLVQWGGIFGQVEMKTTKWTWFASISGGATGYKRIDYWREKDLVLADTTIREALGYNDTLVIDGNTYTMDSKEARFASTDWFYRGSFTAKTGANYKIDDHHNIFTNIGFLTKAPQFRNVYTFANTRYSNVINEKVFGVELGYGLRYKKIAVNVNLYRTNWFNRPYATTVPLKEDPDERVDANVNISALHQGIEVDFAYDITEKLTLEGLASIGDWTWESGDSTVIYDENGRETQALVFDADGVHVGDAAQIQVGGSVRYEPINGGYISLKGIYFDKYYTQFEPTSLTGPDERRESWELPSYCLFDLHAGYRFDLSENTTMGLQLSVLNLLNNYYLADGTNNGFEQNKNNFNANSANVFFGQGTRFSGTVYLNFY